MENPFNSMAVVMGFSFMAGMVMVMGFKFNLLVLMGMAFIVVFMNVSMFMLVRMGMLMLMHVGMGVLFNPVLMGMLVVVLMSVLVFVAVIVLTFHPNSPLAHNCEVAFQRSLCLLRLYSATVLYICARVNSSELSVVSQFEISIFWYGMDSEGEVSTIPKRKGPDPLGPFLNDFRQRVDITI
jgi:hypothetical protein